MPIPVTLLYGGANALLTIGLGANISLRRLFNKKYGRDLPDEMQRAHRAHGNNAEWVPLGLVLLLLAELGGGTSLPLHLLGGGLLLARVTHATGMLTRTPFQMLGATLTYVVVGLEALYVLGLRFNAL